MKLGNDTGSIVNWVKSQSEALPDTKTGATQLSWTDRYAFFVTWVSKNGKEVMLERAKAVSLKNELSEDQAYRFERYEEGNRSHYKLRKRYGSWWILDDKGKPTSKFVVVFGYMDEYRDPSF